MANQAYQLNIRLHTPNGEDLAATFFLGNSPEKADALFNQLHGRRDVEYDAFIYFELVEVIDQLPVNLKIMSCDLDEAGLNMKLILKELFKNTLL